jgi:hypothetical protein
MNFCIDETPETLGIPYTSTTYNGGGNVGYLDLKRKPELIADIYELKGRPELQKFIELINRSDSRFRSLRCDWSGPGFHKEPVEEWRLGSYVTVAFEILERNNSEALEVLCRKLVGYAKDQPADAGSIIAFKRIQTVFNDHPRGQNGRVFVGTTQDLFVQGIGPTALVAEVAWKKAIAAISGFFAMEAFKYPEELAKGAVRIS